VHRLLLAAGALLVPSLAAASPSFMNFIPNGTAIGCAGCHTNQPATNRFGDDVRARLVGGNPSWPMLWMLDSDGDGQTNGQELGDPCGVWRSGQPAPRTTNISNPGGAGSMTPTPNEPPCGAPDAGLRDTGLRPDTGAGAPDAQVMRDAGVTPVPDAGAGHDAGFVPIDGGVIEEEDGGCTCVKRRGSSALAVLAFALVFRSARRRR
jgi:hypothetical protein